MACFASTLGARRWSGTDSPLAFNSGRIAYPFDQLSVLFASDTMRVMDGLSSANHSSKRPATNKMHVKMKNFLIAMAATINQQPVTVFGDPFLFGDVPGYDKEISKQSFISLFDIIYSWNDFVWNNQNVAGCLRIDVPKGGNTLILKYDICRNFLIYNLAKKRFFGH